MKVKKHYFSVGIFFCMFLFFSCQTIKQPSEIFSPPDYTQEDVVNNEIRRIEEIRKENSVLALWRAVILEKENVINDCLQDVTAELEKAVEDKNYLDAMRLYRSLSACGFTSVAEKIADYGVITENTFKDVPGLSPVDKKFLPKNVTDCINATVTVWVDKGIKVERGAGFADIVIGSGFFIDERGYIVTNHHVISDLVDKKYEGYARLYIRLASDKDTRIPAKVIGYDSVLDLALLKTEVTPQFVLQLGSSSDLGVGDRISAIGTPLGLEGTLTQGIVSSVDRKLLVMGNVMQIDAAINSGNSGGPLIDSNMRVQAIAFAGIQDYQGLNFAIPVEYLRQDLPYLFRGGEREHTWSGTYGHTVKLANGRENGGLEVQYKIPGGSASRAGIPEGAVIMIADGTVIDSLETLQTVLRSTEPRTIISLTYSYEGEVKKVPVYLESRPENPGYNVFQSDLVNTSFVPIFGMELVPSSTTSSREYMIKRMINGSIADEYGFSVNDSVTVNSVKFSDEKNYIMAGISTRRSKRGYIDIMIGLVAPLNTPYYF